jgi:DNA primase
LNAAIGAADPDAREVLERAAVADLDVDPEAEARNLIAAAVRRELGRRTGVGDLAQIREDRDARLAIEELATANDGGAAAEWLLGWLHRRSDERPGGGDRASS